MPTEWREGVLSHADAVAAEEVEEVSLRYPSRAALRALELPAAIVVGERSQPYFRRIAGHLQRLLPDARLHSVAGASHAVHLDAPVEVSELLT
jgi:pimeloyl-ACP methyl ester carboxylesterase